MKTKKGIAIILAMVIITIAVSLASYMIEKQNLLIRKSYSQKISQNILGLGLGSLSWAKLLLQSDRNNIDYRRESWLWKIDNLDISDFLYEKTQKQEIYLSAYMQDVQSKFNINNLVIWQQSVTNQRVASSISKSQVNALTNLFKIINVDENLALKTANYVYLSNKKGIENSNKIPLKYLSDLKYVGFDDNNINKLKNYISIVDDDTKININTCDPKIILAYLPQNSNANFFEKNPNIYANNITDTIKYLNLTNKETEIVNEFFDVRTKYVDVFANIKQQDYQQNFYARINKETQEVEDYTQGETAKNLQL